MPQANFGPITVLLIRLQIVLTALMELLFNVYFFSKIIMCKEILSDFKYSTFM